MTLLITGGAGFIGSNFVHKWFENYKPWKKLIGTPKEKLKLIELDNVGHGLPWDTIVKHHSNWIKTHTIN